MSHRFDEREYTDRRIGRYAPDSKIARVARQLGVTPQELVKAILDHTPVRYGPGTEVCTLTVRRTERDRERAPQT